MLMTRALALKSVSSLLVVCESQGQTLRQAPFSTTLHGHRRELLRRLLLRLALRSGLATRSCHDANKLLRLLLHSCSIT